ncbi:hypothetical protein KSS87_000900, partial [Heliosperma pusillum]
ILPPILSNLPPFYFGLFTIPSPFPFLVNFYTYFNHITPLQYPTIPILYLILITLPHNNNYFNHFTPQ